MPIMHTIQYKGYITLLYYSLHCIGNGRAPGQGEGTVHHSWPCTRPCTRHYPCHAKAGQCTRPCTRQRPRQRGRGTPWGGGKAVHSGGVTIPSPALYKSNRLQPCPSAFDQPCMAYCPNGVGLDGREVE